MNGTLIIAEGARRVQGPGGDVPGPRALPVRQAGPWAALRRRKAAHMRRAETYFKEMVSAGLPPAGVEAARRWVYHLDRSSAMGDLLLGGGPTARQSQRVFLVTPEGTVLRQLQFMERGAA